VDVKPGYRQTEVGVIPEDWEVRPLDSTAFVTSGKRLPLGRSLTDQATPHPYIRVTDMRPGTVSLTDIKFVPVDVFPAIRRFRVFKEDLFISVAGTLGIVSKVPPELVGANLTENADRITEITCSQDYLLHVLMSPLIQNVIDSIQTVGAQPKLALTRIRKFLIPLPPTKAEQQAIAEALSDADALIESLEQLLAKKRQLKQGAMQEFLTGKRRLPKFSREWREVALGEMGRCHRGVSYNPGVDLSPFDTAATVRLLRSNNVQAARIVFDDIQFVDSRRVSPVQRLQLHDILICMANGSRDLVGKAGLFTADDGFPYTFGAFMGCFRPNDQIADPDFVFYLFQTEKYRAHISILLAGSSINNLTPASVEALSIHISPDRAEQAAIAAILSDMDAEITALEAKLNKARQIKQGMMQELLTGRIRLV
jgi:type I restriction enzyme S subunit